MIRSLHNLAAKTFSCIGVAFAFALAIGALKSFCIQLHGEWRVTQVYFGLDVFSDRIGDKSLKLGSVT